MITPVWRSYTAQAVVKGPDGSAGTDPTVVARQTRRGMAKMIQSNFGRELMESRGGGPNSLLQAITPKVDILA
jgi:hypothetical protein